MEAGQEREKRESEGLRRGKDGWRKRKYGGKGSEEDEEKGEERMREE